MNPLIRQAIVQGLVGVAFCLGIVFLAAGTWHYWQGWLFLCVFSALGTGFTTYLAIYDKPLLERRMKAGPRHEQERSQQIIVSLIMGVFFAFIILSAPHYRFHLSRVPTWVSLAGNAIIVAAYSFIFWVIKTNSWAAANVRVEADQKVIDTGPYAYIRHPMYAGGLGRSSRNSACARLLVDARARDPLPGHSGAASPRRREGSRAGPSRLYGLHATRAIPTRSTPVVRALGALEGDLLTGDRSMTLNCCGSFGGLNR